MRNWYYFIWLCGDHIIEQHIHNLDVINWVMKGHPVEAQGMGGRQVCNGTDYGEIFDHHMVEFTYADGTKMLSQCRHQPNTSASRNTPTAPSSVPISAAADSIRMTARSMGEDQSGNIKMMIMLLSAPQLGMAAGAVTPNPILIRSSTTTSRMPSATTRPTTKATT